MNQKRPILRCAIYTRVSTEHGLEQEFNSLDNQREAAEAYIKSQAHEGWRCLPAPYDDGGFSGGSMDRPALQRLLADIKERRIDVVVVYKVDRLTRSLADFAKLVELFDALAVSFVSVTQAFNTTTSMGRLTLNVLLSFAQFEREVTGERIRDKIAASKRKGIRMGGPVPLGYDLDNKRLVINQQEAEGVRYIFRRYLELGSLGNLLADLRKHRIRSKITKRSGRTSRGGIAFTRGPLAYLLKNRVYVGDIAHKEKFFAGEHEPIVERALFDEVQAVISSNAQARQQHRINNGSLLRGRIYDDRGNRMTPVSAKRGGARFRYYASCVLFQARKDEAGSVSRVPAPEIEAQVLKCLMRVNSTTPVVLSVTEGAPASDHALVEHYLDKVIVRKQAIELVLRCHDESQPDSIIEWSVAPTTRRREVIMPDGTPIDSTRPIRSETRARLVEGIAKGRLWLDELVAGHVLDTSEIAKREGRSERSVRMTIGLAFLSPTLVKAAVDGSLPDRTGITQLSGAPERW